MRHIKFLYLSLCFLSITGCIKFVELDPPISAVSGETAYRSDATALSVMTGLYQVITSNTDFTAGAAGVPLQTGLLSDELRYYSATPQEMEFATNSLRPDNDRITGNWNRCYKSIYTTNDVMEGVSRSATLSQPVKDQLIGEAKFMRAFMLFYLVNLYGKVPVPLSTDYKTNITLSRKPVNEVYQQIVADLKDAQSLLKDEYLNGTNKPVTNRVRPNKVAATAMLARTYLYMEEWANAEASATEVISRSATYKLDKDLNSTFLVSSQEAIWQLGLDANGSGINTWEGNFYPIFYNPVGGYPGISLSEIQMSILGSDKRAANWTKNYTDGATNYPYAYKYKVYQAAANSPVTEHLMVLRLAEQFLIRAEARAMQGKIGDGVADINVVRDRSNQPGVSASNSTEFMSLLEKERQLELFTEWGHRWLDIKRWKGFSNPAVTRADEIMPAIATAKGGAWKPEFKLWPIPESEILSNVNLNQNPGYGF